MNNTFIIPTLLTLVILLSGCSGIEQAQAEQIALNFIDKNVQFFSKAGEERVSHKQYTVNGITSYQEAGNWVVITHISAQLEGEEKKNDMVVEMTKKGKVTKFNGRDVPQ